MFFVIPWKLRQAIESRDVPAVNLAIITANVLFYLLGWSWPVGPAAASSSIVLYAFSHCDLWHLVMNMWALWIFGNAVNRRLGNVCYALVYLGAAALLGLFARLTMSTWHAGGVGGDLRRHCGGPDPHAASDRRDCLRGLFPLDARRGPAEQTGTTGGSGCSAARCTASLPYGPWR